MSDQDDTESAPDPRRAFHFNAGFLTQRQVRRIVTLAGYDLKLGVPTADDDVIVWGHSEYAARGEEAARSSGAHLVRVEDAPLRSLFPGREGEPPIGLVVDRQGCYFDASQPSDLEDILASHPFDDTALLNRAREVMARMKAGHLSKFSGTDLALEPPDPGYVLVIDQTEGDASVRLGNAGRDSFQEMLYWAAADHPGAKIVVKSHPETASGHRPGYLTDDDLAAYGDRVERVDAPLSLWRLFDGAVGVYTVTSGAGFEAIIAGHRPVTFGQPYYAGWGLTDDRQPLARRKRQLTRAQLVAGAMVLYPKWYDPYRDRLCEVEDALGTMEALAREWREDRQGYGALGMSAWKRPHLRRFFGRYGGVSFEADAGKPVMAWASKGIDAPLQIEDGFLRSQGLGAKLVPPLSLVRDDLGIYYDPSQESRLERLIDAAAEMPPEALSRAERLIARIRASGVTKYNTGEPAALPDAGGRPVVLVPGQVEDDASIRLGTRQVSTNAALLEWARNEYPRAFIIYKPHPDAEAGLRAGALSDAQSARADHVARNTDPDALIGMADRVVTMTSGLGFEALLRDVPVTTLGTPFYAGWGLCDDRGDVPLRRRALPSLAGLVYAVLINYPRYLDPVTGLACPVEVAVARLEAGEGFSTPGLWARLQAWRGWFGRG